MSGAVNWGYVARPSNYATSLLRELSYAQFPASTRNSPVMIFGGRVPVMPQEAHLSPELAPGKVDNPVIPYAEMMITELWPEMAEHIGRLVRGIYTVDHVANHGPRWGCVCGHNWTRDTWTLYTQAYGAGGMAEGWIHETAHLGLHQLGVHLESWDDHFLLNAFDEYFESPVRKDKLRPMGAVLQGFYSYVHVVDWELRAAELGDNGVVEAIRLNRKRLIEGIQTIEHNAKLTRAGKQFWTALADWADELITASEKYATD